MFGHERFTAQVVSRSVSFDRSVRPRGNRYPTRTKLQGLPKGDGKCTVGGWGRVELDSVICALVKPGGQIHVGGIHSVGAEVEVKYLDVSHFQPKIFAVNHPIFVESRINSTTLTFERLKWRHIFVLHLCTTAENILSWTVGRTTSLLCPSSRPAHPTPHDRTN